MMKANFTNLLTDYSRKKFQLFPPDNNFSGLDGVHVQLDSNLIGLLDDMVIASGQKMDMQFLPSADLYHLQRKFIEFDQRMNSVSNSKLQLDVKSMTNSMSFKLHTRNGPIFIHFLYGSKLHIAPILHAIHTFSYMFPYNYSMLSIYICLDNNKRNIDDKTSDPFTYMHQTSQAFNVGGVTRRYDKEIILSRTEEIIKLLYHEMVHFIGLDSCLINIQQGNWNLAISTELNFSEAYTEFLAIVLNAAYQSIHLAWLKNTSIYQMYHSLLNIETQYSLYLVSNILRFYGYSKDDYQNFFYNIGEKNFSPIATWEYVVLRTQLLLNMNHVGAITRNWQTNRQNCYQIISLMKIDKNLINDLSFFFKQTATTPNISYTMVDLDWTRI